MTPQDSKALFLAKVRAASSPTRAAFCLHATTWITLSCAAALFVFEIATRVLYTGIFHKVQVNSRPPELYLTTILGSAAIAGLSIWSVVGRGRSMLGRSRSFILVAMLLTPAALFAWKSGWTAQFENMSLWKPSAPGLWCLGISLSTALSPLAVLVGLRRGSDPDHPIATGAALGVAAGAGSWVLVDLWCPLASPMHLLLGHVLPIALLAVLGGVLGKIFISVRAK
jgi:hypothetical protein